MSSIFCTVCGTILVPKTTSYGRWMSCPHGHAQPELNQQSNILTSKNNRQAKRIEVTEDINHLAVHDHICSKCGYTKAELIEISCSYSDEDNCYRMKCGRCKHIDTLEGKLK